MRNKIVEMLISRGYEADLRTIEKNNVKLNAIVMGSGEIRAVIYIDEILSEQESDDPEKIVNRIIDCYEKRDKLSPIELDKVFSYDFIVKNITIGLQQVTSEEIIKRPTDFGGIEQYLMVLDDIYCFKVREELLNKIGIDIDKAWEIAMDNLIANTILKPLNEELAEKTENPLFFSDDCNITIISNTKRYKGAAAILNRGILRAFAENNKLDRFFIIPSSIHECLLVPYNEDLTLGLVTGFLRETNRTTVDDIDILSNYVYEIKIESDGWRISYGK